MTAAGDAQVSGVESPLRAGKHHPVHIIQTSEHSLGPEGSSQVESNEAGGDHRAGESRLPAYHPHLLRAAGDLFICSLRPEGQGEQAMKSLGGSRQPWFQHTTSEALGKSSHLSELHFPPQSHPLPPEPLGVSDENREHPRMRTPRLQ